ncbi:Transcription factor DIVARICATA [Apostasia shenzhenica]|uniref:Transcription factor MYBS1 n=1 Tax=Apostasia shenzhenica TaxID=1088818 RepID=A0A2H9ZZB9_9ASPA|nr:Transcription factor DIVARICATA [Apostasia shenzhenica]
MTNPWRDGPGCTSFPDGSLADQNKSGNWTQQENKLFENALAHFDIDTPNRWDKVAEMIPGKTVDEIISHYRDLEDDVGYIEAGLIPTPGYSSSSFTLDWENDRCYDDLAAEQPYCAPGKRSGTRLFDQERKKGVPWSEEEHKRFLMGLKKYGKGDWRNISRNFVLTRTPTQVASHAQKYFIRLNSGGKDKKRASIHDITTVCLPDNGPSSPSRPSASSMHSTSSATAPSTDSQFSAMFDSQQPNEAATVPNSAVYGDQLIQSSYGVLQLGIESQGQQLHQGSHLGAMDGHQTSYFR